MLKNKQVTECSIETLIEEHTEFMIYDSQDVCVDGTITEIIENKTLDDFLESLASFKDVEFNEEENRIYSLETGKTRFIVKPYNKEEAEKFYQEKYLEAEHKFYSEIQYGEGE